MKKIYVQWTACTKPPRALLLFESATTSTVHHRREGHRTINANFGKRNNSSTQTVWVEWVSWCILTVAFSVAIGTSYISLMWLSKSCWEWDSISWLRFFRDCLGGRAGGGPSTPSGDLLNYERNLNKYINKRASKTSFKISHFVFHG